MHNLKILNSFVYLLLLIGYPWHSAISQSLQLEGLAVIPHIQSTEMRYRQETDRSLGTRVQIFLRNEGEEPVVLNPESKIYLRGQSPEKLLQTDQWAWHDFPSAYAGQDLQLPPGALTVWSWNGKRKEWGIGTAADFQCNTSNERVNSASFIVTIDEPKAWISSVTYLGQEQSIFPSECLFHIANNMNEPIRLVACRLWLPEKSTTWRVLTPQTWVESGEKFPRNGMIPAGSRGGMRAHTGTLPLTYGALEVKMTDTANRSFSLWAYLRIKKEAFDISGGWIASNIQGKNTLTFEPYLKILKRMHINTGHFADVPGYTNNDDLYQRYPLKLFNKLAPFEHFDTEAMLPKIHAVEFLGEPQYGGGRPVPPMEVWYALSPYQSTRLTTTVTHSEERIWRFYAGVCDYPHYDAYRVCAPSADAWRMYERWGSTRLSWGAPLETIGAMTRSLRELNRPSSIAYWSQGAHDGWDRYGGRRRTAPTPAELRAQTYHALAARITSLYWFNLSLKSLLAFPDLIEPITRIGREINLLKEFYLEGDTYHYERILNQGQLDWDISVISGPKGALLFALDLNYQPNLTEKIFEFGAPRMASLPFPLPDYLGQPKQILRVSSDRVTDVPFHLTEKGVKIETTYEDVNIFVVTPYSGLKEELELRIKTLAEYEKSFGFDPAHHAADLDQLRALLKE